MSPEALLRVLSVRASLLRPTPVQVQYELTHRCNLDCKYCDRHTSSKQEIELPDILKTLHEFCNLGMQEVSLDGGEPLVHPHVGEVVRSLTSRGIVVRMNTNGILVPARIDVVRNLSKLKISLDGTREVHDKVRGRHAFDRAIEGSIAARDVGVEVEWTCVVGSHNADEALSILDLASKLGFGVVYQPARTSLFVGKKASAGYELDNTAIRYAFDRIEYMKRKGAPVRNHWTSLRHFRRFPFNTPVPCAAGWINATMDPTGNLFACGQLPRTGRSNNAVALGVREAFARLPRVGCSQCWCARVVEENMAWGGRFGGMIPPV